LFFYLSKILWFCLQPSALLLILLIAGAALMATRHHRAGRRLVLASTALLLIGGLLPLSTWLILPLEERFARTDLSGRAVDGIIILGGMEDARVSTARHAHAIDEAAERLTEAAALAKRFPQSKIVLTGGSAEVLSAPTIGADAAGLVMRDLGVGDDRLLLEREARDTWENAVKSKALVGPKPGERWLLVTSAWHMPRAVGVFRKARFAVEPWPVDYRTVGWSDAFQLFPFESPAQGLRQLDLAVHEWLGLMAYRLTGRSDEVFPGPS
jgi:uncharacterized SAM-binding protein YcdF (DUF218 family)